MVNKARNVSLRELVTLEKRPVIVEADAEYAEIGIYCFGRGIFHKTPRSGLEVGDKKLLMIKEGDFIFQITFAWEGAVAIASKLEDGMYCSSRFPTFRVNEDLCHPRYLLNYFRTPDGLQQLINISPGSAGRNRVLSLKRIPEITIPLPPIEEQRRIVARIEELAGAVAEARGLRARSIEDSNILLSTTLNHIFDKSSHQSTTPLKDVAEISRGKFTHRPRNEPRFYGGDIPFIQIGDISNSKKYIREYSQTLNEEGLKVSRIFSVGTIVIAITGATIGATGILTFDSCFPDSIVGITSKSDKVMTEYIYWALEYVKKDMLLDATQTTQPNINLQHFAKLSIVVPSPHEQRGIVASLDNLQAKVDALKRLQTQTAAELDALLPSILDKAFKGEL
jgi:type I restriction enzyme, S subunit